MTERLNRLRKRFGIMPDRHNKGLDIAVQICSAGLDAMKADTAQTIDQAVNAGFASLPPEDLRRLRLDANLNLTLMATVLGMLSCLTTEWHN